MNTQHPMKSRSARHRAYAVAASLAFVFSAAACGGSSSSSSSNAPGVEDKTITIGLSTPQSGPLAVYSSMADATTCYLKWVNANGGASGYKFDTVSVDNQGTVSGGANAMNQLLGKKPFAIQVSTTPAFSGAAQTLQRQKSSLPVLALGSGATIKSLNLPNVFGIATDYTEESFFLYDYIVKTMGKKNIVLLHDNANTEAGQKAQDYITSIGGTLVKNISVSPTATNMAPYVQQAVDAQGDAVVTMLGLELAANFVKTAKGQGLTTPMFGYSGDVDASLPKVAGAAADGYHASSGIPPLNTSSESVDQFKDIASKCGASTASSQGAFGWSGGALIVAAVKQVVNDKAEMTAANFTKALFELNGKEVGLFKQVTITRDAHYALVGKSGLTLYEIQNGEYVPVNQ